MTRIHWLALMAVALLVAPKVAAVVAERWFEVEELKLQLRDYQLGLVWANTTNGICVEAMRGVIWKEEQRRHNRRSRGKNPRR